MSEQREQAILAHLTNQCDQMVRRLQQFAEIETPSHDADAQQPMLDLLQHCFLSMGFRCRRLKGRRSGGQLLAVAQEPSSAAGRQLLLGHCDTVWPHGSLTKMPISTRDGKLYGPGVFDMKGGLVQMIFALQALHQLDLTPTLLPVVFINSDEEIGSEDSDHQIIRLAKTVDRTLVLEPSLGPRGMLKTARKGVGRFVVRVTGKAAHAGLDPEKGISAIKGAAEVVQSLFAMNDPERGISVNVGTIQGGMRPNVIAPECQLEIDVRVASRADVTEMEATLAALQTSLPGTTVQVSGSIARPPLERTPRNQALWRQALDVSKRLDISIQQGSAGGGSDGNWASLYTATLDGLGAVGDGAHAVGEHVIIDQLPRRAALLACLMLMPAAREDGEED